MIRFFKLSVLILLINLVCIAYSQAEEQVRRDVRFYKANKILQTDRIWFTKKKAKQPGCHNFLKKTRVYKIVQFGYEKCQIFAAKDCRNDSQISVRLEDAETVNTDLTIGKGWYPISENPRGVKLRSWQCQVVETGESEPK